MSGTEMSGLEQLLSRQVEEHKIIIHNKPRFFSDTSGLDLFEEGFLHGFGRSPGLRYMGANVVSPWLGEDGSSLEEGDEVTVPVSTKRPFSWYARDNRFQHSHRYQQQVTVRVERVSTVWDDVSGWVDQHKDSRLWYQMGRILGAGLAEEAEYVYHFNSSGGLLEFDSGYRRRTVSEAAGSGELLDELLALPLGLASDPLETPPLSISDRGVYLLNPLFWGSVFHAGGKRPVEQYALGRDPFMRDGRSGESDSSVLAAFGDWYRAFTIVEEGVVTVRFDGKALSAEMLTGGSVTPTLNIPRNRMVQGVTQKRQITEMEPRSEFILLTI